MMIKIAKNPGGYEAIQRFSVTDSCTSPRK